MFRMLTYRPLMLGFGHVVGLAPARFDIHRGKKPRCSGGMDSGRCTVKQGVKGTFSLDTQCGVILPSLYDACIHC